MSRNQFIAFLTIILVVDAMVIAALIGATTGRIDYAALAFVLGLAVPWAMVIAIMWGLLRWVRWGELVARYPMDEAAFLTKTGRRVISLRARFRGLRFNNGVEVISDDEGLHMRPVFPAPGARGVSIPWSAMTGEAETGRTLLGERLVKLETAVVPLWVPARLVEGRLDAPETTGDHLPA